MPGRPVRVTESGMLVPASQMVVIVNVMMIIGEMIVQSAQMVFVPKIPVTGMADGPSMVNFVSVMMVMAVLIVQ